MKTKLLRKVRKRFDINYYPNGFYFHSEKYYNDECYNRLLENILYKYKEYGTRRNKKLEKTEEKLWYQTTQ